MTLGIFYPNGHVEASLMYIWDGASPIPWDGSVAVTIGPIAGGLTNNNAAPSTGNLGVLPAVANAAAVSYTEGRQVLLSTDLAGNLRVISPAVAVSAVVSSVNDLATNVTLLASLATRKGYKLYNDSTQIAYVKEGTTATTADYSYQIQPLGYYESVGVGVYTGKIDCIWAADGTGAMKITELS